ncbi:unnamed protein product [Eruca vesicaria subsp. sativa]|uniref:Gnk2-homologous domain-containing protein n=1 Tax=Eruca vesicaria subsp. sativa TaxID=29727 RepID=A0ABC8MAH1_ERUVS|nr:unnamed protein product [Eruca vesicaria subsp. sativa]
MEQRSSLLILGYVLIVASVSPQTCIHNGRNFETNTAQDGFYSSSIGQEPSRVYAAGISRVDANDCSACIKGAFGWLIQDCTNHTDAYYLAFDPILCLVCFRISKLLGDCTAVFGHERCKYQLKSNRVL